MPLRYSWREGTGEAPDERAARCPVAPPQVILGHRVGDADATLGPEHARYLGTGSAGDRGGGCGRPSGPRIGNVAMVAAAVLEADGIISILTRQNAGCRRSALRHVPEPSNV